MSHRYKVVRIRWCVTCEGPIPARCENCKVHPDRKPRIVELFGLPKILETAACGCCVRFQCQRPGCPIKKWCPKKALEGRGKEQNHYCSKACAAMVKAAAIKANRVSEPCSCGCGRIMTRPASAAKTDRVYFSQKCHYAHRVIMKIEERRALENCDIQSLACYSERCRGAIRDHKRVESGAMACSYCNRRRSDDIEKVPAPPKNLAAA